MRSGWYIYCLSTIIPIVCRWEYYCMSLYQSAQFILVSSSIQLRWVWICKHVCFRHRRLVYAVIPGTSASVAAKIPTQGSESLIQPDSWISLQADPSSQNYICSKKCPVQCSVPTRNSSWHYACGVCIHGRYTCAACFFVFWCCRVWTSIQRAQTESKRLTVLQQALLLDSLLRSLPRRFCLWKHHIDLFSSLTFSTCVLSYSNVSLNTDTLDCTHSDFTGNI